MEGEILNTKRDDGKPWDLFISWHDDKKDKSKSIVIELKKFINFVLPGLNVFCSASISSGDWSKEVDTAFKECEYAIFLLMEDAIQSHWITFECGAFYMKALSQGDEKKVDDYLKHFVIYDIQKSASGKQSPIKKLQVVAITEKDKVFKYFERLGQHSNDNLFEKRFEANWGRFQDNRRAIADDDKSYIRKEYVDDEVALKPDLFRGTLVELFFDSRSDYIDRNSIVNNIKTRLESNQFVNLVGMGGCGKTTITYNFYNEHHNCFSRTTGKVINGDFYKEFNEDFANRFKIKYVKGNDVEYDRTIFRQIVSVLKEYKRTEAHKYNLFVLDVNEDSNYSQISEAIIELKNLSDWRFLVASREPIEALQNTQIDLCKIAQDEKDEKFLKQVFYYYLKDRNEYYKKQFTGDNLKVLFNKFGYLPLLVEQLAYYLDEVSKPPTFVDLIQWLGDDIVHSDMAEKEVKRSDKYQIVGNFLSKLMDFDKRLKPTQKTIAKYLMMWPAEYYSTDFIQAMSGVNFGTDFDKQLNRLCDKCILDRKIDTNGCYKYKMHSMIASSFRDQVFTKESNKEYRDFSQYIDHLNGLTLPELDEMSLNCIKYSLSHFASFDVKYLLVKASELIDIHYSRHNFIVKTADDYCNLLDKSGTSSIGDNALKIKVISLDNHSIPLEDIYKRIAGEIKEDGTKISPMPQADVYYNSSLMANAFLPDEQTDQYGKYICIPVNGFTIKMRKIFGGTYQMGDDHGSEKKSHKVTVDDFYIGETQVTQALWDVVMKGSGFDNPSRFNDNSLNPVERVSWFDCYNFIFELYKATGHKFRLPTEAEWEYAARSGGKAHKYSWTDQAERESKETNFFGKSKEEKLLKQYAWYKDNSQKSTHKVADRFPNELDIYDMSGNVWEWCQDLYDSSGSVRVMRGGSWDCNAVSCRLSHRNWDLPGSRNRDYGFRLSLSSQQKKE